MWKNSQYLGSCNNRFGTMDETMAVDMAGDLDFETVRSKRRKRNLTEVHRDRFHRNKLQKLKVTYLVQVVRILNGGLGL